jgi:hypothetical protein
VRPLYPAYSIAQRRVIAPTITVAPVLTWDVTIGSSPAVTPPTYTGSPGTITYTLRRDGVPVAGLTDVSEATIEAHVGVGADITPALGERLLVVDVEATVTNGAGSDSAASNAVSYYLDTHFRDVWDPDVGVTLEDGDTTVESIADQGPGGVTLASAGLGTRPTHNASDSGFGGEPSMTFDGADDILTSTSIGLSTLDTIQLWALVRAESASVNNGVWVYFLATGASFRLRQNGADATAANQAASTGAGTVSSTTGQFGEGVEALVGGTYDGAVPTQSAYLDSATAADTDIPAQTSMPTPLRISLGNTTGASQQANVTIALAVLDPSVDSVAIDHLVAYCSGRFGVP